MNTKPIQEFIILSKENLCIAEAVAEALPDAMHHLAIGFLHRLDVRLKESFPNWKSKRQSTFFGDPWGTYHFGKTEWEGQYGLALQFADGGRSMAFGVLREKNKIGNRPFCDELFNAVKEVETNRRAEINAWWEIVIHMDSPAENWRKPEVLWLMHTDEKFLEDVTEQLLELAKISEPFLDGLVCKYTK